MPNYAPAPNRRPRFAFAMFSDFEYLFCAPASSSAAVGEAQRSPKPERCVVVDGLLYRSILSL